MLKLMQDKKFLSLFLALIILISSITACNENTAVTEPSASQSAPAQEVSGETALEDDGSFVLTEAEKDLTVREAFGKNGVVSTASPIASKIGLQVLENGGNAVDAAVAVSFALSVVEPNASGIGGDGYMLVYDAKTKEQTFIDYKGTAPSALTPGFYASLDSSKQNHTGVAALIPGVVAGMHKANELFGSKSFAELIEPAVQLAENGFPVTPHMAKVYSDSYDWLKLYPETEKTFLNDGFPYAEGEIYKNHETAETFKLIAEKGPEVFYKGEIAEDIVASVKEAGGIIAMEDLAVYEAKVKKVVSTTYRDYTVISCSPGSGGVAVLEALNLAEHFDVEAMGHNSPAAIHMWAEIFKLTNADRRQYIGDSDFADINPALNMAEKSYAKDRVKIISMDKVQPGAAAGLPIGYEGEHTTHISIIDKDGNMVAMTNTHSDYFGCAVTVKNRGFVLNDLAFNFSTAFEVNKPQANKRARSTISPLLILKPDGTPLASLGTPGSSRIVTTLPQLVSNIIDFDMDIQQAINVPRIYQDKDGPLVLEGGIDDDTIRSLESKGHIIELRDANSVFFGGAQGVLIKEDGTLHGAADPRRDGKALAY